MADVTGTAEEFRRVGDGRILYNQPYDIAAAALIVSELGRRSRTFGAGRSRTRRYSAPANTLISTAAAANDALHAGILQELEVRFRDLRT